MYNRNKINTYENQNITSFFSAFDRNTICAELSGTDIGKNESMNARQIPTHMNSTGNYQSSRMVQKCEIR